MTSPYSVLAQEVVLSCSRFGSLFDFLIFLLYLLGVVLMASGSPAARSPAAESDDSVDFGVADDIIVSSVVHASEEDLPEFGAAEEATGVGDEPPQNIVLVHLKRLLPLHGVTEVFQTRLRERCCIIDATRTNVLVQHIDSL